MIKIDFHTHTHHSYDSMMLPRKILALAKRKGLNAIVINDHNTIKGGLEAKKINPYPDLEVIVGAEIKTDAGDITGIYLKKEITSRNFLEVANEIKSQGGLVILNHPYVDHKLDLIDYSLIDFIEVYNARLTSRQNNLAIELAREKGIPFIAGSDAHTYSDIGKCYVLYERLDLFQPKLLHYSRCSKGSVPISQFQKSIKNRDLKLFLRLMLFIPKYLLKYRKKFSTKEEEIQLTI